METIAIHRPGTRVLPNFGLPRVWQRLAEH